MEENNGNVVDKPTVDGTLAIIDSFFSIFDLDDCRELKLIAKCHHEKSSIEQAMATQQHHVRQASDNVEKKVQERRLRLQSAETSEEAKRRLQNVNNERERALRDISNVEQQIKSVDVQIAETKKQMEKLDLQEAEINQMKTKTEPVLKSKLSLFKNISRITWTRLNESQDQTVTGFMVIPETQEIERFEFDPQIVSDTFIADRLWALMDPESRN